MLRPTGPASFKFREKASVFLTELHPAAAADERAAVLTVLRKRDHDANHHCTAWREGVPVVAEGADDDGEPGGTAGAPMLRVLAGADVTDALAVCIRWFGGTKLGRGGLVRAYTDGIQGALADARARGLLAEVRVLVGGRIRVPPEQAHLPFIVLGAFPDAEIGGQEFDAAGAVLRFRVPPERREALARAWQERSRGGAVDWDE
jgi:putative IMPACT (imprinted ancient) family translation regulator